MTEIDFMQEAIKEAYAGIEQGHGGPFGCVIVKDGKIIGRGHNTVVKDNDPTCHGEMNAIRQACKEIKNFSLAGAELYTTGEPCPMCATAIAWANINKVFYGCTIADNEDIGFRDKVFAEGELAFTSQEVGRSDCLKLFSDYKQMAHKSY
ncbi:MAG: nucleoside deaminase [Phascolarctobacterium sp.]|nr:nucleoside deaminase [Phascolarctobacterium sp.]